jgi:alkylation response protein AidB-like acyl-CoA dehydrogenase
MLETAMATAALLQASPSPARDAALSQLAEGLPGALGLETSVIAQELGDGWLLNGTAQAVVGGAQAQVLVLETHDGFFLVPPAETERLSQETLDVTRPVATVSVYGLALQPECHLEGATAGGVHAVCETLVAAEAVGAAEACLDLAVEYAKTRHQFDQPIGTFQAIQHKCADMMVAVESARSATWYAAWALDSEAEEARLAAHTAKALATDTLSLCAGESIQIHGGIGFTWEHEAHLYFKRARASLELLGTPRSHRAAVAEHLLGPL